MAYCKAQAAFFHAIFPAWPHCGALFPPPCSLVQNPTVRAPPLNDRDEAPAACRDAGAAATAGLWIALVFALLAGGIAWGVFHLDWVTRNDLAVAAWMQAHHVAALTSLMLAVSWLHATPAVSIASIALCAVFLWQRRRAWFMLTLLVLPGGALFNWGLKHVFQRARPSVGIYVQALHSYSFPSGHTIAATLFYGLLALWLGLKLFTGTAQRIALAGIALACIATVAFSRIYLGVHFLSDVLAAFCVGSAWLALGAALVLGRGASSPQTGRI